MTSTAPPRRFKIEPLETSIISSKGRPAEEHTIATKPVRSFAPEPVETTTKTNRRFTPEPTETSVKTTHRFTPELVEVATKTNRQVILQPVETSQQTNRKFAPEPIETTQKTNRRFTPVPIETTVKSSREKFAEEWGQQPSPRSPRRPKLDPLETTSFGGRKQRPTLKRPPGKFSPQLIETAQRSRKANDNAPTLLPSDKTDATPDFVSPRRARILGIPPTPPVNTPTIDITQNPLFLEIQQGHASCPLARRRSYFSASEHSFRVPDLDTIESSESEASTPPSPTISYMTSEHSFMYTEVTRRRESVDDHSSGYLLELAARTAERQLREQAMAAFPNDDYHEPVAHYVDRDTDELDSNAGDKRGTSFTEINWDLKAMRKYQDGQQEEKDRLEKQKQAEKPKGCHVRRRPAYNAFGKPPGFLDSATAQKLAIDAKDPELERMRKGARPPMLGNDIKFPRCESPEPSRFDPTQGCDAVRTAMCYLSEQTKAASEKGESLWCGQGNGRQTSTTPSLWSTANSRASSTHGLWGGMCVNGGDKSPRGPTGILTPMHERANPLSPCPTPAMSLLPPTPPASTTDFSGIDEKLAIEQTIAVDFSDDFVTQVYNYLSLGYPSMARPFDGELSKISGISVFDLRQDDDLAESRGYIRLGKDGNLVDSDITEETCVRWRALRTYIQEWARQHPGMAEEEMPLGGQGTSVRKGSWAL